MKTVRLVLLLLCAMASLHAAAQEADLKEKLVQLETDSWKAWKSRDAEFFKSFLSDDHVEVGRNGVADKARVLEAVGSPQCVVESYDVDRFTLKVISADTALLTYHARQSTKCNGVAVPSPAWASSLYVKRGGRWLNVMYQQSPATK